MDISKNWHEILNVLRKGKQSNKFFSIATVDENGNPHVTPIGHVYFRNNMTGYYFDAYSKAMPKNFITNNRICLMAVNSGNWFWLTSLLRGRFASAPAVRLFGEVSDARDATAEEIEILKNSIKITSKLKGHELLWGDLTRVRDMTFTDFSPATYPVMCDDLWQ